MVELHDYKFLSKACFRRKGSSDEKNLAAVDQ